WSEFMNPIALYEETEQSEEPEEWAGKNLKCWLRYQLHAMRDGSIICIFIRRVNNQYLFIYKIFTILLNEIMYKNVGSTNVSMPDSLQIDKIVFNGFVME
ncbi:1045_t:CDS:1, partial [Entrophospora sp. SA101]